MIYVDTSVVLAYVLAEDQRPDAAFWHDEGLVASRLVEYEAWVRLHAYGAAAARGADLAKVLARVNLVALDDDVCARTRAPFPVPVRTLDALHLAAADFLRGRGFTLQVASYDARMREAAQAMGFGLAAL